MGVHRRALVFTAIGWVLLALVRTGLRIAAIPRPLGAAAATFGQVLLGSAPLLFWAPAVVALSGRLSWRPGHRARTAAIHLALAAGVSLAHASWEWFALPVAGYPMTLPAAVWYLIRLDQTLFLYVCVAALGIGLRYRRRLDEALIRSARLEAQLLEARLHVLGLQLHPHFLFNTLNAVSELVHRNAGAARAMLSSLRELLQRSLDAGTAQEIALRDELRLLEPYAAIQRIRFADSLSLVLDLSRDTLEARVPRLVLQPLVENAIRHGTSRRAGPGRVAVRSRAMANRLILEVEDDGGGLDPGGHREGMGLSNTRARLRQLFGDEARLTLEPGSENGTIARLECPLRLAADPVGGTSDAGDTVPSEELAVGPSASRWRVLWGLAAACLAFAAMGTPKDFLAARLAGEPAPFDEVLIARLAEAGIWFGLCPVVFWMAGRLAGLGVGWAALIGIHLVVALVTIAVHVGLLLELVSLAGGDSLLAMLLVNDFCVYAALAAGAHAWSVRRADAERRADAARLDAELAAARLESLRWRLRPDLLFGALDRIGELAVEDPEGADDLTGRLGDVLRLMLQSAHVELVPLERELELVSACLEVEQAIRNEAPRLETAAVDAAARAAPVPAMLLLPLVEALAGARLAISGAVRGGTLELSIRSLPGSNHFTDDCLLDLRRRLHAIYGGAHRLAVRHGVDGISATLRLPEGRSEHGRAVA